MKIKELLKKNGIFVIIAAVMALAAYLITFSGYLSENPFASAYKLNNPVKAYFDEHRSYFIIDSGDKVLITNKDNKLETVINSSENGDSFYRADEITYDESGNIYILDKLYSPDDSYAYREKILKFDCYGKFEKEITCIDTINDYDIQIFDIYKIRIINEKLYFICADLDSLYLFTIENDETVLIKSIKFEDAYLYLLDADFDTDFNISYVVKDGCIYFNANDKTELIYDARKYDNDTYFSIVSEIVYNENGLLYALDIGHKNIMSINTKTMETKIVVECNEKNSDGVDDFPNAPIYSEITANNGIISFLSSEYILELESEDENYLYKICAYSESKNTNVKYSELNYSLLRRIKIFSVYICFALLVTAVIYLAYKVVSLLKGHKPDRTFTFQITVLVTALTVTISVSYYIFGKSTEQYIGELKNNLVNTAYRIAVSVDENDINKVDSPNSYMSDEFENIDDVVLNIIGDDNNNDSDMYCVIYKVVNDIVCEIYRDDMRHSVMYPMAGKFDGSIEEEISEKDTFYTKYGLESSEGTYIYALVPVYSSEGETIAFIEIGTDYGTFTSENMNLYISVLLVAAMAVIIVMLMFSEIIEGFRAVKAKIHSIRCKTLCSPDVIRPLSFIFFFIANMSTAFLPIYGLDLWTEDFPLDSEIAAALPLSAEFIFAAVSAFICGFIIQKLGIRVICILGACAYIGGNLTAAFAENLWVLILSNILCGIGSGFLSIAFNTWAVSYEDEESQNKGFTHINASYLAGLNCGTVIGSLLWESFGVRTTFIITASLGGALIVLICFMAENIKVSDETKENENGTLKDLANPSVIGFFTCILTPYLVCTAFLEYFFPIVAEENNLSATQISMAFLISGLISIYAGASISESITEKLGTKRTMILASFIYALALFYLVLNPSVISCYIVIAMFAIADSFGLSAQSVYYSSIPAVKKAGQSKALGVNNTVESITSACGSVIFGAALMFGYRKGIFIIAAVFIILLLIYIIFDKSKENV